MRLLLLIALAACHDSSVFQLKFRITDGDTQQCFNQASGLVARNCTEVQFPCGATLSVRVLPPERPFAPFISFCGPIPGDDACKLANIDLPLPAMPFEEQRLMVQMAIYANYLLPRDAENKVLCPPPTSVKYDAANGFPLPRSSQCEATVTDPADPLFCWPTPSLGGVAYYSPGDPPTVVELGCSDQPAFSNPLCTGNREFTARASVNDFDNPAFSVDALTAQRLSVAIGEPKAAGAEFVLKPADTRGLVQTASQPTPAWSAVIDNLTLTSSACIQVREEIAQSTATLTCYELLQPDPVLIDKNGIRLRKQTLDQIVNAIETSSGTTFTFDRGLVIGLVLDENGNPLANQVVSSDTGATISYLSNDRSQLVAGATSNNGIFISEDATYGTHFSTSNGSESPAPAFGGLVNDVVTISVLKYGPIVGQ